MSITATERTEIEKLLVLMFNAAPGATYLSEVTSLYESVGHNLNVLATVLDDIPAFNTLHPNFQTAAEFAADFLTPLGLQNDTLAKNFVIDKFNAGVSKGQIMYDALQALEGVTGAMAPQYVAALAILNNKTEVSHFYSVTQNVAQTDIAVLQLVLNGVTADHATVTTAEGEISNGTRGTSGIQATLTPSQDTVTGTNSADIVTGLFGDAVAANNTFTAGDSVDLGAGTDRLNLVALGVTPSQAITVKNVESINIQDTVGATFNALLVENAPGISFESTIAGKVSMVTNAALGSVMGLSGKGDLTVDYANTTGKADAASVSLNGAGTSATARSTVNVADGNTVEKVTVATAGTNFVTLTGGTAAASLVITGAGTNNFSLSAADSLAAVAVIDASASTGANTFALGGNLNTGSTIKGGTGADTVTTTFSSPTLVGPTISGVETLNTTFTAAAVVDLGTVTGLTAVGVSASTAAMKFQNAQASVATVAVTTATTVDQAFAFGYAATTKGDLALKIGSAAGAVDLGAATISNSNSLAVSTVGALAQDIDNLKVTGNQTALSFTVGADAHLTLGDILATGNLGSLTVTTGAGSYFSGQVNQSAGKSIGDITVNATGTGSEADLRVSGSTDHIGNISFTATGNDISGYITATTSGGSIGNVSITVTGDDADVGYAFSAGYVSGDDNAGTPGNIGNVTISVTGDDNVVSGGARPQHGNIGDVTMTVNGDGNTVGFSGHTQQLYYYHHQTADQDSGYYSVHDTGNIGNTVVTIDGDSQGYLGLYTSGGGTIGDVTISLSNGADLDFQVENQGSVAWKYDSQETAGNIGNINITLNDSTISGSFSADGGDIGNVSISVNGDDASGTIGITAAFASAGYGWGVGDQYDYYKGGNIGNVALSIDGNSATMQLELYASGGSIGTIDVSVNGDGASAGIEARSNNVGSGSTGGDIGAIHITMGDDTHVRFDFTADGAVGPLTVAAGDDVQFYLSGGGGYSPVTDNNDSASMGAATLSFGDGAHIEYHVSGFSGSVGTTSVTAGDNTSGQFAFDNISHNVGAFTATYGSDTEMYLNYREVDGAIGAVNITAGAGSVLYVSQSGGAASMGKVTLTGGDDSSSAGVYVSDAANMTATMGGVDASAWLGTTGIDLEGVTLGTTIRVGAAGSWTEGTEGADNIFLAAGKDTVLFDDTPTATDVLFNFTVGAGKDVMDLNSIPAQLKAVETVDAAYTAITGDILRLVNIDDGNALTLGDGPDLSTAANLAKALSAAVAGVGGEYVLHDFTAGSTVTVITAASATANTFYVFEVKDVDGGTDTLAAEITLMGVVNATAASAIGGLVAANFA